MSQFPHDQFAKDLLEALLSPFGRVETDRKISSEVREAKQNRHAIETELLMSLRTSPIYLEHIEQVKSQSRSEGLAEGRTAEGRELVLKQLTRKLGMLSPELTAQINELSLESPHTKSGFQNLFSLTQTPAPLSQAGRGVGGEG
ncbi:MAG: DUF4351 domain-containing protein [Cyanosarcina radialis HA8281-LM2]|jgi:hypothetical protein|nr:DUF4351 domain-containing protein [Cyanosarcina radialis HA8281-LM2]